MSQDVKKSFMDRYDLNMKTVDGKTCQQQRNGEFPGGFTRTQRKSKLRKVPQLEESQENVCEKDRLPIGSDLLTQYRIRGGALLSADAGVDKVKSPKIRACALREAYKIWVEHHG